MAPGVLQQPVVLREAKLDDAEAITRLAESLGYSSTLQQVHENLARRAADDHHCLLVALLPCVGVVGCPHVFRHELVACEPFAELGGVIVDEALRGRGIGEPLIEAARFWAKWQGATFLRVRTREDREAAHRFYCREGFDT
ncbi:MAG: hypothetical protein Kow006_08150 [Gammaproteobacteria bacterium]